MSFASVKPGMKCRVSCVLQCTAHCRRLMELGLVPGAEFEVVRVAPLGDPVEICIEGAHLALRRRDGAGVWVEQCS